MSNPLITAANISLFEPVFLAWERNDMEGVMYSMQEAVAKIMPTMRNQIIADENAWLEAIYKRIIGNAHPEEDSRLDVAYVIARHLKMDCPAAYTKAAPTRPADGSEK